MAIVLKPCMGSPVLFYKYPKLLDILKCPSDARICHLGWKMPKKCGRASSRLEFPP